MQNQMQKNQNHMRFQGLRGITQNVGKFYLWCNGKVLVLRGTQRSLQVTYLVTQNFIIMSQELQHATGIYVNVRSVSDLIQTFGN